ncbi:LuxR C-terminal-related transcriptional regulator [Actinocrispum sp. NPDC049592]|uniref:LuxR C-terminal-related transcriptional regulator n=1 Tax=Actinocrispum sp. NPDC049592 TaxID=3154835 RepID=UPI00341C587E
MKSRSRVKSNVLVLDREQRELLVLLASGLPDTAIARRMCLAPRTLARRISTLYQLLQADNRFQAGAAAERLGLLNAENPAAAEAPARLAG